MRILTSLAFAVAVALTAATASAQGSETAGRGRAAAGNRELRPRAGRAGNLDTNNADQQALTRRVRQAFAGVVRRQLNLSDEKWRQFQRVDKQFQQQRNAITRDERQTRFDLKAAMEDTANVDQAKIAQYLSQLTGAQRRRADLLEAEQKELATFLTPLQRAKLQALREQLQQRVRQIQQQSAANGRGAPTP
jgi:Spy/CpxP family protein refolding chaperone